MVIRISLVLGLLSEASSLPVQPCNVHLRHACIKRIVLPVRLHMVPHAYLRKYLFVVLYALALVNLLFRSTLLPTSLVLIFLFVALRTLY